MLKKFNKSKPFSKVAFLLCLCFIALGNLALPHHALAAAGIESTSTGGNGGQENGTGGSGVGGGGAGGDGGNGSGSVATNGANATGASGSGSPGSLNHGGAGGGGVSGGGGGGGAANVEASNANADTGTYGGKAESFGGDGNYGSTGGGGGGGGGSATASHNTLTVTTNINDSTYGGYAQSKGGAGHGEVGGDGGASGNATASYNKLIIKTNGVVSSAYGGSAASIGGNGAGIGTSGNAGFAKANNNTLTLEEGGAITRNAYGGHASVGIGYGDASSTVSLDAEANNNTVNIIKGSVGKDIYGGYAFVRGNVATATANNNTVNIIDPTSTMKDVIGGVTRGTNSSRAENNTVTLSGAMNWDATATVAGGSQDLNSFNPAATAFTGNKVHFDKYSGSNAINTLGNFEKYQFTLGKAVNAHDTIVQVDTLYLDDGGSQSASIESISIENGHSLKTGDTVTLIQATNAIHGTLANDGQTLTNMTTFTEQKWLVNQNTTNNAITAQFEEISLAPQAGAVAQSYSTAATGALGTATTTLVGVGIPAAQGAASGSAIGGTGETGFNSGSQAVHYTLAPFAVIRGGYNTYHTGSHVDVSSVSAVGGLGFTRYFDSGELLLGAFFETGTASYNSYNNIGSLDVHGHGYLNYFGGGLFARHEFHTSHGRPYMEASARFGTLNYNYETHDIQSTIDGSDVSYDISSNYYGIHFGGGYIWDINQQWVLDVSAKYFWTHQFGSNANIGGDNFEFEAVNSNILRVGAVLSYDMFANESYTLSPYAGLAYEYEFDSEARAKVNELTINNPSSIRGGTGVLELGLQFSHTNGLSINLGAEGSLGMRDGIMGELEIKYEF